MKIFYKHSSYNFHIILHIDINFFKKNIKWVQEYYPKHLHMLKPTSFKINEGRQLSIEDLSEQLVELQQSQDDIKKLIQRFEKESIRGIS